MKTPKGVMTERQAERIIEMYENASRNGKEWAHNVFLRRGTNQYEKHLNRLNEAFFTKSIETVVEPLKPSTTQTRSRTRSQKK